MTHPSIVIHPSTGEIIGDLQTVPLEVLADTYLHLQNRERELKDWRQLLATELQARLAIRQRTILSAGDYEIRYEAANESVWDADELELVLQRLADEGVITPAEATGIIRRPEPTVDRTQAKRLRSRGMLHVAPQTAAGVDRDPQPPPHPRE
jgi:hypothetical protein